MQQTTKEIHGRTYTIIPLTTSVGMITFGRIIKIAGPAILLARSKDSADNKSVADVLGTLVDKLDAETILDISKVFAKVSTVTNKDGAPMPLLEHFDTHFAGNYMALIEWFLACLEVNYSSFLGTISLKSVADFGAKGSE